MRLWHFHFLCECVCVMQSTESTLTISSPQNPFFPCLSLPLSRHPLFTNKIHQRKIKDRRETNLICLSTQKCVRVEVVAVFHVPFFAFLLFIIIVDRNPISRISRVLILRRFGSFSVWCCSQCQFDQPSYSKCVDNDGSHWSMMWFRLGCWCSVYFFNLCSAAIMKRLTLTSDNVQHLCLAFDFYRIILCSAIVD